MTTGSISGSFVVSGLAGVAIFSDLTSGGAAIVGSAITLLCFARRRRTTIIAPISTTITSIKVGKSNELGLCATGCGAITGAGLVNTGAGFTGTEFSGVG